MRINPTCPSRHVDEPLRVAIAGPLLTKPLAHLLATGADGLPVGVGGSSSLVGQLVSDLVSRGQRVTVVTLDHTVRSPVTAQGPLLEVVYGPFRPRHRMRDLMRTERHAVRDAVLRTRPALVHAQWCYEYALGGLASGVPTLISVHDWMPTILRLMELRFLPYWSGRTLMYFSALARAKYLTANSPYTAEKVRRFTRASLDVVPNGVPDNEFLISGGHRSLSRPRPDAQPIIISVNNGFSPWKNVRRLLAAYHTLGQRGIHCDLHLVGEDYEPGGACEAWARLSGLSEGVTFLGPLPHDAVLAQMRDATLLVHPAREESFGMTLVEAMSQRLPIIAGAHSGAVPWVLGGGRAGLLANVDDPRDLALAMAAVLARPALRARLAGDGYARAWHHFRQSLVTDLYLDVYRRVLAEDARRL